MKRSITVNKKSRPRGRPKTTGTGTVVGRRWHDADLAAIDAYAAEQGIDRSQAIYNLVKVGLASAGKIRRQRKPQLE